MRCSMDQNREFDLTKPFNTDYFQGYYQNYRDKIEDLFDSEKHFIYAFVQPHRCYLDIGCATGGMSQILSAIEPTIRYTGIDIAPKMIDQAQKHYPHLQFQVYDGEHLPFPDNAFERVLTLGTTVHDLHYKALLREAYRVAVEALFFDIRLINTLPTLQSLEDGYVIDGSTVKYPYIVVNVNDFLTFLADLTPKPATIKGYGYWGKPNRESHLPKGYETICMATFLITKGSGPTQLELTLPFTTKPKKNEVLI